MRLLRRPFLMLWILFQLCLANQSKNRSTDVEIKAAITGLPHCCLNCVMPILTHMSCNLSNLTSFAECFCSDIDHQKAISECTGRSCSFQELMESEKNLQVICAGRLRPTRQPQIYVISTISCIFVTVFVALRCYSNYLISKKFWWDDVFLLVSTFFFLAFQFLTIWGATYGFGLHIWTADTSHWTGLLLFEWTWELIYIVVQTMTKVSVLLLYYRIFPQLWFRRLLFTLIVVMFVHFIAFSAIIVNACKPIQSFWNHEIKGRCIDTRPVGLIGAAFSIVEDVVFLCLPMPLIWKLKLKTSRKIGIILILTIGVVACAASVVRLKFLIQYNQTFDQIWDNYIMVVLSQVELSLSIICVCFPAIRLLFSRSTRNLDSSKTNTAGAQSTSTSATPSNRSGFLTKILSIISSNTSRATLSIPWISSRAPQLSSIYITSQIELTDKNKISTDANLKDIEPQISESKSCDTKPFCSKIPFSETSEIVHVDKTGTLTTPLRKLTDTVFRGENKNLNQHRASSQNSHILSSHDKKNTYSELTDNDGHDKGVL